MTTDASTAPAEPSTSTPAPETSAATAPAETVTAAELVASDTPPPTAPETAPAPAPAAATSAQAQEAPQPAKRGPGRPSGSKNKPRPVRDAAGKFTRPSFADLPPAEVTEAPAEPGQEPPPGQSAPPAGPDKFRQNAEVTFDMLIGIACMGIGPEWAPQVMKDPTTGAELSEREMMVQALDRYYRTKNMPDLPPGWALAVAGSAYAMRRMQVQNTRSKLQVAFIKVRDTLGGLFGRLFKRRGRPAVRMVEEPEAEPAGA